MIKLPVARAHRELHDQPAQARQVFAWDHDVNVQQLDPV